MLRLLEGVQTQNEMVPHPPVVAKSWEAYMGCDDPPEELGDAPT